MSQYNKNFVCLHLGGKNWKPRWKSCTFQNY